MQQASTADRTLRATLRPADIAAVRALVQATGFFSAEEVAIAAELVEEALERGAASGYRFLLLEQDDALLGYTCYGEIPGTSGSYDLYWIVVGPEQHGRGHGRRLLDATEAHIGALGGRGVYAETSSRAQYAPTRAFYVARGFHAAARLPDFYAPGDGKVIYAKSLQPGG